MEYLANDPLRIERLNYQLNWPAVLKGFGILVASLAMWGVIIRTVMVAVR